MLPDPCVTKRAQGIVPAELIAQVLDLIPIGPDAPCNTIGDGPYCEIDSGTWIYIHWGPVSIHADDAGLTYGYMIKGRETGTGACELRIDPDGHAAANLEHLGYLDTDSAFIINSNLDHEVDTDDGDLMIFITRDFDNEWDIRPHQPRMPTLSFDAWLDQLPVMFEKWIKHATAQAGAGQVSALQEISAL